MRKSDNARVVLISGCSSGFGALCARVFFAAGDQVVATMRTPEKYSFTPDENIDIRELDVTRDASIQRCVASVLDQYGKIDILINNAGIHLLGAIEDMQESELRRVFETNFFGALNLARAVLPAMRQRGQGRIITVSSIGSMVGRATDGVYCASKAALEIALEAMKYEVERFGIEVSVVCPGAFKTDIARKLDLPVNYSAGSPYQDLIAYRLEKVQEAVEGGGNPLQVARLIKDIADDPAPQFRYVVGDKASQMQQTLTGLSDAERHAVITRLAGLEWWVSGAQRPYDRDSTHE